MSDQQITRFYSMNNLRYTTLLLLAVFAAMAYFSWWVVSGADRQKRADLLQQTRLVAQALEVDQIQALSGTEADLESPHYRRLKEHLAAVRSANLQCRFVYLMGRKADGTIFFFVDSELAGSKDYSPPGQIYNESTADLLRVFDTKAAAVEGPVTDRWGTWISTMVPMIDPRTGAVLAVLGMDINARIWKWDVAESAALPLGLMLVLLIGVVTSIASVRRIDVSPKPVLRRLMPPLTAMVILLIIGTWALMYQQHRRQLAKEIAAEIFEVSNDLNLALDQQALGLSMAARPIAADVILQNDLRIRDFGHLLSTWSPIFETLQRENHLTHFYFFDSNRICLIRLHNPDKRGDLIDRFTAIEAERTGKTASGIELGDLGTFTLRVVQPVFEGGRLVGYVELGKEIEDILKSMHSRSSNQLVITIHKEHLNRNTWEEGMHLLGREADWDRLPHSAIIYNTLGYLPDAIAPIADQDIDHPYTETDREFVFDGKYWLVSTISLPDVSGTEIGNLLILHDITAETSAFANLLVLGGTAGVVLLALLLSFIYVLLQRTDKGIHAQQAELRGSEERFRLLFDGSKDAIYVYLLNDQGLPGRFIQVNQEACLRLGYLREELLRMTPLDIAAPGMAEVQSMVTEKLKTVGSSLFESTLLAKDGQRIPVECFDRVLTIDGELAVLSTSRDITDRKRIEDALRESEEKFRLTYYSSPDAVNINRLDDGLYVDINEGFARTMGYTREEVIGRTSLEINIWHDPADRQKLVQGLLEKGYYENLEAQFQRKDGSLITALMSVRVFSLKGVSHIISLTRDITDRKLAEDELLENRRRLADIIEFLPDATLAIDKEKRIIIWNREIEKMTGVSAAEMIGKGDYAYTIPFYGEARPQLMDLIFMDNKDIMARYPNLIREGDSLVAEVFCNALYNNKGAWVFLKASPLHDQSGNIIGAIESIRDITERKRAEEALRESEEKLQRSKKMESLGLLAGGVAHDLNNVLSGIVSYPELILMDLPDDSVLRKPIETMKDSGYRAVAIVQDLLTVARGVATIKTPTNLNDLIRDYLKSPEFKTLSQFHPDAVIRTSLEMDLLNVTGSQIHIRKVLMNLVSNAVEAIPGRGTVTLATMNRYVERPIKGYEDVAIGEYAVLSVSDDGPGISGDDLERVFEPFYSKKVMGRSGTGLGLAVVWNVVQDHKGYIDVTTGMNGTTFELYFPITREDLVKENLPIFIDELKGNGETILVVDDLASQRTISCAILNKLGYRTTAVSSGEEAIEFLKENPVDLLLLDMIMDPGINGRETYSRALVIRPEQKAIIVSGFAQTEEVLEAKRLGTVQFLRKPVSIEKIGLAVKKALGMVVSAKQSPQL